MIANAISPEFFEENQITKASHTKFTVLMPARIDPRKDHQTLLEALRILKKQFPLFQLQVILIGEVNNTNTQQQINTTITKYNLESVIQQLPVTNNTLPHYHAADICVLPSISEEFPNVILESLATKTPIIVSEAANRAGLIQNENNGWIFPTGDSEALAHCIKTAWETPNKQRATMGEQGQLIASRFTIAKMVARYQQLYKCVVKRV